MLNEVAPPGWGHTKAEKEKTKPDKPKSKIGGSAAAFKRALDDGRFKGLPGDKTKKEKTSSMFKLMWAMKNKGAKPHYKPGTDEKKKKYQDESFGFEIDSGKHKTAQKKSKMRNLARGNENPNEKAAAEKKAGGPKLAGEDWKPEIEHVKGSDLRKKAAEKKRKAAADSLPPHLRLDVMKKAFASANEETSMKDNNLFGDAYAGSYETLKKKIGSKKKHDKPAIKEEKGYKEWQKAAREAHAKVKKTKLDQHKKNAEDLYKDRKKGIPFYDKKGSGRIVKGRKVYN